MTISSIHRSLWAKSDPYQSLWSHMIAVGATATAILEVPAMSGVLRRLAKSFNIDEQATTKLVGHLAALHDIGKAHPDFQMKKTDTDMVSWLTTQTEMGRQLIPSSVRGGIRHEYLSADNLAERLAVLGWGDQIIGTLAAVIQGHHGTFERIEAGLPRTSGFDTTFWAELRQSLWEDVKSAFGPWPEDEPSTLDHSTVGVLLTGLIILADWIASSEELMPRIAGQGPAVNREQAYSSAKAAIKKLGFDVSLRWGEKDFLSFWDFAGITSKRPIQRLAESVANDITVQPGLAIIEAPMGEGKTEAGVYLAAQWSEQVGSGGLYIALPTMATSNQMHGRIQALVERHARGRPVQLVHGMAWLIDDGAVLPPDDGEEEDNNALWSWFQPLKRALLAPYGVGTVDQAMKAALTVKHGALRILGLTGKTLVIDEVHAYDVYMNVIIMQLLDWCGYLGIPVVLLSATLPANRRRELLLAYQGKRNRDSAVSEMPLASSYPLLTVTNRGGVIREFTVPKAVVGQDASLRSTSTDNLTRGLTIKTHKGMLGDIAATADLVIGIASHGGCIGAVMNTVLSAQSLYRELRRRQGQGELHPDTEIILYHARFPACRRQEIEREVLQCLDKRSVIEPNLRPKRMILVATQVVEQSLDIDLDVLVSELAPIDLLLQRAGRLWRHLQRKWRPLRSPELHVLAPAADLNLAGVDAVYHAYYLIKTLDFLNNVEQIALPDDIRQCVEKVYDPAAKCAPELESVLRDAERKMQLESNKDEANAENFILPRPNPYKFSLANERLRDEQETETAAFSYLRPSTRKGDDTKRVIILDADDASCIISSTLLSRDQYRRLMLHMVSLPGHWLQGVKPVSDRSSIVSKRLRGVEVLIMENGEWHGSDPKGNIRVIRYSPLEGLSINRKEGP